MTIATPVTHPIWQVEDSIPLRVLVQLVVFAGIGAVDAVAGTNYSSWAIPLSAIAAAWGWYARRRRNIPVKFCIAIAMIAMLAVFLGDLVGQRDETRLLLARLLIELQVLHSFDLPRRKDLGYSVVIGLILMSVAASISQTMIFALWLMLFLLLVVPFLILDHRSRLGVAIQGFAPKKLGINPLPLVGLLTMALVLGLTIFAVLPRFGGFQLRNFPVSVNLNVDRETARGSIVTRAQAGEGGNLIAPDGEGTGTGGDTANNQEQEVLPSLFGTELDATQTSTGTEALQPQLVMRVRSQARLFWRVMSYDQFTGKGWRISRNMPEQIRTVRRPSWSYEFFLQGDARDLTELANPNNLREVVQTYTITTDLFPNLVPAATIPYRLFFPSDEMDIDLEGNLRAPGPLPLDLTYTVISGVPVRNPNLLRQVRYRPNSTTAQNYLQIADTPQLKNRLTETSQKLLGNKSFNNAYDLSLALTEAVKANYQLKNLTVAENEDIVSAFLREGGGQPIHFVSTLVLLLRSQGIPARYVVGFGSGRYNPFTGFYEVQNTDAQSLVEVFFPNHGWLSFDPVPGNPPFPSSVEDDRTFSAWQSFWQWLMGLLPPFVGQFFAGVGAAIYGAVTVVLNLLVSWGWVGAITGVLLVFGLLLSLWALWQSLTWLRDLLYLRGLHPADRTYTNMLRFLAEKGLTKYPHQTPQEYLQSISDRLSPWQWEAVQKITQAYQDWRYGDRAVSLAVLQKLLKQLMRPLPKVARTRQ